MTGKELQRLSRQELLELLVQLERENEKLCEKIAELEETVRSRSIEAKNPGTMAEAAMTINSVFESADRAAVEYIENIRRCSEQQQSIYDKIVSEAEQKAKEILDSAEEEKAAKMKAADDYWKGLSTRLEDFYKEHKGLKERLINQSDINQSEER